MFATNVLEVSIISNTIKNYENAFITLDSKDSVYSYDVFNLLNDATMCCERTEAIKKINNDLDIIKNLLSALDFLRLELELSLVGGAVRDFYTLSPNKIKDLDILVTIPSYLFNGKLNSINKEKLIKGFSVDQLINVGWSDDDDSKIKAYNLIKLCFLGKIGVKKSYSPRFANPETILEHDNYTMWEMDLLNGVIKLEDTALNYPCDILISKLPFVSFMERFDFEICKVGFDLKEFKVDWTLTNYNNSFCGFSGFLKDYKKKILTTVLDNRSQGGIEKSMNYHFPRLQKKYPTYKLIQEIQKACGLERERLEKIRLNYQLSFNLGQKQEFDKKIKI